MAYHHAESVKRSCLSRISAGIELHKIHLENESTNLNEIIQILLFIMFLLKTRPVGDLMLFYNI